MKASINGKEVIHTLTYVLPKDSVFVIIPFDDDLDFKLKIDVRLGTDVGSKQKIYLDANIADKTSTIVVESYYLGIELALATANPLPFAVGDDGSIYGAYCHFRFIGPLERFTTVFDCTIVGGLDGQNSR